MSRMLTVAWTTSTFGAPFPPELNVLPNPHGRSLSEEEILAFLRERGLAGIVAGLEPLSSRVLENADGLKVISRCGAGVDNVDLEAARRLGIAVYNTPEAPADAVAEHAVMLMLGLLRHLNLADASMRAGAWEQPGGALLGGKTVGIVGCGRIGSRTGRLAAAFGCRVLGTDPADVAPPGFSMVSQSELLSQSDIVSLHTPLTESTRHLIGRAELGKMKPGALLVNTSRGPVVDEEALLEALRQDRLGGAALDVYEREPYAGPLSERPAKTLLTPHVASNARESRARMETESVANLVRGLREAGLL